MSDPETDKNLCRDIVLVVDEAHLLIGAEHYRKKAVDALKKAINLVRMYGGTVITRKPLHIHGKISVNF